LQFLEVFTTHKSKKVVQESNITNWRRTVCGNLVSTFQPYHGEPVKLPLRIDRNEFVESIHGAQFKKVPDGFRALSDDDRQRIASGDKSLLAKQEKGTRTACAIPYELYANGALAADGKNFEISLQADKTAFGSISAGSPFHVYAPGPYREDTEAYVAGLNWQYAVAPGDTLLDQWPLAKFEAEHYFLRVYGPNGFFREFTGNANDPGLNLSCGYEWKNKKLTGNLLLTITNTQKTTLTIIVADHSYGQPVIRRAINAGETEKVLVDLTGSRQWYDVSVKVETYENFAQRFCGKVEQGAAGSTDPAMAG
jgi:phospholipase C